MGDEDFKIRAFVGLDGALSPTFVFQDDEMASGVTAEQTPFGFSAQNEYVTVGFRAGGRLMFLPSEDVSLMGGPIIDGVFAPRTHSMFQPSIRTHFGVQAGDEARFVTGATLTLGAADDRKPTDLYIGGDFGYQIAVGDGAPQHAISIGLRATWNWLSTKY